MSAQVKPRRLSWKPRKYKLADGVPLYCSPACGRGCRESDYREVLEKAADLCRQLGAGWTPDIWENLGWHWFVKHGAIEVWPTDIFSTREGKRCNGGQYSARINGGGFGPYEKTPEEALRKVAMQLVASIKEQILQLANLKASLASVTEVIR